MARDGVVGADGGVVPPTNDLVAGLVILGTYITRYGILAEGVEGVWWHVPLILTTDLVIPLAAALWLLVVPVWTVWKRYE